MMRLCNTALFAVFLVLCILQVKAPTKYATYFSYVQEIIKLHHFSNYRFTIVRGIFSINFLCCLLVHSTPSQPPLEVTISDFHEQPFENCLLTSRSKTSEAHISATGGHKKLQFWIFITLIHPNK
jgi:hypothetical protein